MSPGKHSLLSGTVAGLACRHSVTSFLHKSPTCYYHGVMKLFRQYKLHIALAILVLPSVLAATKLGLNQLRQLPQIREPNLAEESERRFAALKESVPPSATLGFISDEPRPEWGRRFRMARYTLSPVAVVREVGTHYVVGNLTSPDVVEEVAKENGLEVVQNFGDGVVLYRVEVQ